MKAKQRSEHHVISLIVIVQNACAGGVGQILKIVFMK